jgi:hypothetical protein
MIQVSVQALAEFLQNELNEKFESFHQQFAIQIAYIHEYEIP